MDKKGLDKHRHESLYNGEKLQGLPRLENRFMRARGPQSKV